MGGLDDLMELSTSRLSDRVEVARHAAQLLLEMTAENWEPKGLATVTSLRARRADSPLLLAVTEAALDPNPIRAAASLGATLEMLDDDTWIVETALSLSHAGSLGVLSLGEGTIKIIESYIIITGNEPELYAPHRAVARGLGNLHVPVVVGDPAQAELLLVPAIARHERRVWSTPAVAEAVRRATEAASEICTTEHPVARLSPMNRLSYRPAKELIDFTLP